MGLHQSQIVARWWCRSAVGMVALLAAGAAPALPLDAGVTRELNFLSNRATCLGVLPLGGDLMSCTLTHDDTLVAGPYADPYGSPAGGGARAFVNGLDAHVTATTTRFTAPDGCIDAVQFDQVTVTGPTPTVDVGVNVTLTGTTAQNAAGYVLTGYTFAVGSRSATPNPSTNSLGDRIDLATRSVLVFGRTATLTHGLTEPVTNRTGIGGFLATVGTPFEYGFELTLESLNTTMDFSARVEYTVPVGYTLTSTRGLAVNVPEPGSWALMLAGFAALPLLRRRRTAQASSMHSQAPTAAPRSRREQPHGPA